MGAWFLLVARTMGEIPHSHGPRATTTVGEPRPQPATFVSNEKIKALKRYVAFADNNDVRS